MSEHNVEIVRALFEGGDGESKEAMAAALPDAIPAIFTDDVVFIETPERVDARTYQGHDGVRQAFERWLEQWQDYRVELLHAEDHGDQVLAVVREQGEGAGSGAPGENTLYVVFQFHEGKVSRYEESYEEDRARSLIH